MTFSYHPWLPENVSCSDRIKPLLDKAIFDWSHRWFPETMVFSIADLVEGLGEKPGADNEYYHIFGECLAIAKSAVIDARICQELLGFNRKQITIAPGDQLVLDELTKACLDDLKLQLCQIFDIDHRSGEADAETTIAPFQNRLWSCWVRSTVGNIEFSLVFAKDLVTRFVKMQIPGTSSSASLSARIGSIGNERLQIGAQVGASQLTVAEITQLEVGDVLVLDRKLSSRMNLTINGEAMPRQLVLDRNKDQLALRLIG